MKECPSPKSCKSPSTNAVREPSLNIIFCLADVRFLNQQVHIIKNYFSFHLQPCSPAPQTVSRPCKEEDGEAQPRGPSQPQALSVQQSSSKTSSSKPASLTPSKLHCGPSSASQSHYAGPSLMHSPKAQPQGSPYRGQRTFLTAQPQPQVTSGPVTFPQYNPQNAPPPPPPPPPAPPNSASYFPAPPAAAAQFPAFKPTVASPFPPGSQPLLQTHHALHYQSSVTPPPPPPPPPPHPQPGPTLLHVNLQPPSMQQHQLLLSSAPPPPPPRPPQGQSSQQPLLSIKQGQHPHLPPPPPAPSSTAPHPFQNISGFQTTLLHQSAPTNPSVTPSTYQQTVLPPPPPPPPPQQTPPSQTPPNSSVSQIAGSNRGPTPSSATFHSTGYLGTGWHWPHPLKLRPLYKLAQRGAELHRVT